MQKGDLIQLTTGPTTRNAGLLILIEEMQGLILWFDGDLSWCGIWILEKLYESG